MSKSRNLRLTISAFSTPGRIAGEIGHHAHHEWDLDFFLGICRIFVGDVDPRWAIAANEFLTTFPCHVFNPIYEFTIRGNLALRQLEWTTQKSPDGGRRASVRRACPSLSGRSEAGNDYGVLHPQSRLLSIDPTCRSHFSAPKVFSAAFGSTSLSTPMKSRSASARARSHSIGTGLEGSECRKNRCTCSSSAIAWARDSTRYRGRSAFAVDRRRAFGRSLR